MVEVTIVGVLIGFQVDEEILSGIESRNGKRGGCGSVVMARCANS